MTVIDFITAVMTDAGILIQGQTPNNSEASYVFTVLNEMLGLWSTDKATVVGILVEPFNLINGQNSYTMGAGGGFNTTRPTRIVAVSVLSGTFRRALGFMAVEEWADFYERGLITHPIQGYIQYGFPLAQVNLWPAPGANISLRLSSVRLFDSFASVSEMLPVPPGQPDPVYQARQLADETFPLTQNVTSYSMGPGGGFNTTRPSKVLALTAIGQSFQRPVELINAEQWAQILELANAGITLPLKVYVDYQYPLATLNLWPAPGANTSIEIHSLQQFSQFVTLQDVIAFAQGYEEVIRAALTVRIAPKFKASVDPVTLALAQNAKATITALNAANWPNSAMSPPSGALAGQLPAATLPQAPPANPQP